MNEYSLLIARKICRNYEKEGCDTCAADYNCPDIKKCCLLDCGSHKECMDCIVGGIRSLQFREEKEMFGLR